ncbi:MAG: PASTA domain-containing protein, partial [Candidatus Limnocylindrales bacterium]
MTDQKPDPGEPTPPTDAESTTPAPEEFESAVEQHEDVDLTDAEADTGSGEDIEVEEIAAAAAAEEEEAAAGTVAETEAEAADAAAAAGAAWTTMPVAPDPEATEAALAALAAKPEMTLEPPVMPSGDDGEPPEEGTPVLLVGGILVGAFIVALAIVLILFRPFDSPTDEDASLAPSPVVTEVPSASPTAIATVGTPDFQGMSLTDAESTADDYGLVVRVRQVETDRVPPETVIGQDPPPGEAVEVGSTIALSVAAAIPTQPVPDVVGLPRDEAIDAIEDAGFTLGDISEETSDEVPAGNVVSSDPEVDTELATGSEIALVVSLGPETTAVPDLADLPEADALAALEAADLLPGEVTEATDASIIAGNVISSDPAADAEVTRGTEVDYVLSLGPETTAVPDLADLPEADALAALEAAD